MDNEDITIVWRKRDFSAWTGKRKNKVSTYLSYKNVINDITIYEDVHLSDPPKTVFDTDYDYTKWNEIDHDLSAQNKMDDIITLLLLSNNDQITYVNKNFRNFTVLDALSMIILCALFVFYLFIGIGYLQIIRFFCIGIYVLLFIKFGYILGGFFKIELYNKSFQCQFHASFYVFIAAIINLIQFMVMLLNYDDFIPNNDKPNIKDYMQLIQYLFS